MQKINIVLKIIAIASILLVIYELIISKMKNPVKGVITQRFKGAAVHNGTDVAIAIGTGIKSPANGVVSAVYENELGGLQMIVKHDNGFQSGYAHLSKTFKGAGAVVKEGEIIALSGNSGHSTGPHLHFTLRKNNILIDPETVFNFKS